MQNRYWYLLSKKLSGIALDAELNELEDLLAENPDWHFATNQVQQLWESPYQPGISEEDFDKHLQRMDQLGFDIGAFDKTSITGEGSEIIPVSRKRTWWLACSIAAGIVGIILAVTVFIKWNSPAETIATSLPVNKVETQKGIRSKLVLPDGTQVWLNAGSKLEYHDSYGKMDRNVVLSGEAYFDVIKNVTLPFIITTQKIKIKVTGTAFNVKAYPGESLTETSLIRGRVEVTVNARPDEKYILKPNEKMVVRDEDPVAQLVKPEAVLSEKGPTNLPFIQVGYVNYLANDSLAVETSWMYNRLIFDNESFDEIALKMERWFGVDIKIVDPKIAEIRFTYQLKNETIAQALKNMQYAARFHFDINNNNVTITK